MNVKQLQLHWLLLLIVPLLLASCSDWFRDPGTRMIDDGLVDIAAAGAWSKLGSSDAMASLQEQPEGRTKLAYDFSISRTEVTVGEYRRIMGAVPASVSEAFAQDDFPVTGVSWYAAGLYCNRLSIQAGLDTVYSYSRLVVSGNEVVGAEGWSVDLSASGYRLPTEAEWNFAAGSGGTSLFPWGEDTSADVAAQYAWYAANSGAIPHAVATRLSNRLGLFDMAGNVMEWTQDWLTTFVSDLPANFSGGSSPGADQDVAVKGGSFQHPLRNLRISARMDVYATPPGTRAPYIGFRIVRGPIVSAQYLSSDGRATDAGIPTTLALRDSTSRFFGSPRVKLAWVDPVAGDIRLVNFSRMVPYVEPVAGSQGAKEPVFSPDGNVLAWSSRGEGQMGVSTVHVISLVIAGAKAHPLDVSSAAIPRWWVDPATSDTFLVYLSSAMSNGDSASWIHESTWKVKMSGDSAVGAPVKIADGTWNGGLSADGQVLFSAYTQLRSRTQDGSVHTLFQSPANGKAAQASTQACNASVSPSGDPQVLFLDFGYSGTSSIVGRSYGVHEYLFAADASGKVVWNFKAPPGESGWDYSEWSNRREFAVAASFGEDESRDRLWAVNLPAKKAFSLVAGPQFQNPALWMGSSIETNLNLDSLFQYGFPVSGSHPQFNVKMRVFWLGKDTTDVLMFGSSRMEDGGIPSVVTGGHTVNLSVPGCDFHCIRSFYFSYVLPHMTSLRFLAVPIDLDLIAESESFWRELWGDSPGYLYDASHDFWADAIPSDFFDILSTVPLDPASMYYRPDGEHPVSCAGWGEDKPQPEQMDTWTVGISAAQDNFTALREILAASEARGIQVVGITFPQSPGYRAAGAWGRYGPPLDLAQQMMDSIQAMKREYPHFHVLDIHKSGLHDYGPETALNSDHLCSVGAERVTKSLDSLLQTLSP